MRHSHPKNKQRSFNELVASQDPDDVHTVLPSRVRNLHRDHMPSGASHTLQSEHERRLGDFLAASRSTQHSRQRHADDNGHSRQRHADDNGRTQHFAEQRRRDQSLEGDTGGDYQRSRRLRAEQLAAAATLARAATTAGSDAAMREQIMRVRQRERQAELARAVSRVASAEQPVQPRAHVHAPTRRQGSEFALRRWDRDAQNEYLVTVTP